MKKIIPLILLLLLGYSFLTNPNEEEHLDLLKSNTLFKFNKIEPYLTYDNFLFFSSMSIKIDRPSPEMTKIYLEAATEANIAYQKASEREESFLILQEYLNLQMGYLDAINSYNSKLTTGYFFNVRKENEFDEKIKDALKILAYR
tara:strand:- start:67 stop:501 length:435 start_codon:yes stop_codon:yes gene_type:complete